MADARFPKQVRLLSRGDFRRVYASRSSVSDSLIRLVGVGSDRDYARLGLSISRQHGNSVERNRWKRLVREAFRLSRAKLPPGLDFVVIPRAAAAADLPSLQKSLAALTWRLQKRLHK